MSILKKYKDFVNETLIIESLKPIHPPIGNISFNDNYAIVYEQPIGLETMYSHLNYILIDKGEEQRINCLIIETGDDKTELEYQAIKIPHSIKNYYFKTYSVIELNPILEKQSIELSKLYKSYEDIINTFLNKKNDIISILGTDNKKESIKILEYYINDYFKKHIINTFGFNSNKNIEGRIEQIIENLDTLLIREKVLTEEGIKLLNNLYNDIRKFSKSIKDIQKYKNDNSNNINNTKPVTILEPDKIDWKKLQQNYEDWEKGVIMAWGHTLYLSFYPVKDNISNKVDFNTLKKQFLNYYKNAEDDYDLTDWMSNGPPYLSGKALFDKNSLTEIFINIANKTKLKEELIVYRTAVTEQDGINSYTVAKDQYDMVKGEQRTYKLPKGYPVIFASRIADKNEVILNMSKSDLKKYKI